MRRDDEDPFGDIFDEIERMMGGGEESADAHVDAFDEGDRLRLVADLPGASKESINLQCDGETLTIEAGDYRERVRLPTQVDEHTAEATFNNGVLEVAFEKVDDAADIDLS